MGDDHNHGESPDLKLPKPPFLGQLGQWAPWILLGGLAQQYLQRGLTQAFHLSYTLLSPLVDHGRNQFLGSLCGLLNVIQLEIWRERKASPSFWTHGFLFLLFKRKQSQVFLFLAYRRCYTAYVGLSEKSYPATIRWWVPSSSWWIAFFCSWENQRFQWPLKNSYVELPEGIPIASTLIGFSILNQPFWVPLF